MPQFAYAFDPHAANDDNIVRNEEHVLRLDMTPYRVIIPNFAPFYEDLEIEVKCNGKLLLMGVDFYLSHKYFTGVERTGKLMYGGIWIINPKLSGTVSVKYRTLGGKFTVARSVLDDYLANRQVDPSTSSWEEIINDDPNFPAVDIQFDRKTFVDEGDVQTAVREIADVVRNKDQSETDSYRLFEDWLNQLKDVVDNSPLTTHQDRTDNPHGEVWYEAEALHKSGISKDAAKVFNKTISELTDYVNSRGITQADLDTYVKKQGGNTIVGDVVLKDGLMSLNFTRNGSDYVAINISNGNVGFIGIANGIVHADRDKNTPGATATVRAGNVDLTVTSSGAEQDDDDLTINGKVVIHDGNLDKHLPTVGGDTIEVVTKDSATLNFSGRGLPSDPLRADVVLPTASDVVEGVAVGTVDYTKDEPTKLAFSEATHALDAKIQQKVPNTATINGLRLDRNITLTSEHFGLGNVSNLADINMPVNQNHHNALANKSLVGHTHTFEEMNIIRATGVDYGITFIANDPSSSARDRAFSVSKMKEMQGEVEKLEELALQRLPDDVMDVTQYGGNHWLPVPVQGSYEGSGHYRAARQMSGYVEEDGKCILYRNGYDLVTVGVFYSYATFLSDGSLVDYVSTATRYKPSTLPEGWTVKYCLRGSRTAMYARLIDTAGDEKPAVILFNGSGNGEKHTVAMIPDGLNLRESTPFVHGGFVYIANSWVGGGYGIRHSLYRAPLSDFESFGVANFEEVVLSGTDFFGNAFNAHQAVLCRNDWSDDETAEVVCIRKDNRYNVNVRWSEIGLALATEGDLLRIFILVGTYDSSSFNSSRANWSYSVTINLSSNELMIDEGRTLPYIFETSNRYVGDVFVGSSGMMVGKGGNVGTGEITDGVRTAVWTTHNESTPGCAAQKYSADSYFESLNANTREISSVGSGRSLTGNFGSAVGVMQRHVAMVPNSYLHTYSGWVLCKYTSNHQYSNGMVGLGPHADREYVGEWRKYRHNVYVTNGVDEEAYGGILHRGNTSNWTHMDMDHNVSGSISTTADQIVALETALEPFFEQDSNGDELVGVSCVIYVLPDERIPPIWTAVGRYRKADSAIRSSTKVGTLEELPRAGSIGNFRIDRVLGSTGGTYRHADDSMPRDYLPNSGIFIDEAAGKMAIVLNTNNGYYYTSHTISYLLELSFGLGTPEIDFRHSRSMYSYRSSGMLITKDYGLVIPIQHDSFTAVMAKHIGTTSADWDKFYANTEYSKGDVVLHTSQVAEGWVIYFTQDIQFFINSTKFMIPETGVDLSQLFPSTHKLNTFYIYASVEGGEAHYLIRDQYVVDNSTDIYIGYCKTSEDGITELQVNRATRLGDFREFNEHLTDPTPHGLDLSRVTTDEIGLGLLENKDIRDTLVVPTFKEVFDSWYRLSHSGTKPYPALPEETETWVYDEATDSIRNTTNSSSFIGMVSPEDVAVGDYDFITGLSSTNADDDWIGVIFAMVVIDGVEHTLSALCSGTDTRDVHFAVYYNWGQGETRGQKTLFSHTTTLKHGWDEIPERILTVKRRGDVFNLHITKMMTDNATEQTFSFDVKDHPELSIFRSAVRFGYCSQSQARSTWRNILRPDEDGKNFYASQKLYRDNFSWSNRMKTISGVVAPTVDGDDVDTFDVPIPAEFRDLSYHAWVSYDYSGDSGGGINNAAITSERIGDMIRFITKSHAGGGFYGSKLRYNITFFNDVRMI